MGIAMSLPSLHRFTVDEYHRMGEAGIFADGARIELIAGEIVEMTPIGSDHAWVVTRLTTLFIERSGGKVIVSPQGNPIILSAEDEPQPDLTVVRPRTELYRKAHPRPDDVLLVVEVADSSLAYDCGKKLSRYALAGIPEVWIFDLGADRILVFRSPRGERYELELVVASNERATPLAMPDLAIGPRDLSEPGFGQSSPP